MEMVHPFSTTIQVKLVHPLARVPSRSRPTDAGYDLSAIERAVLPPHSSTIVQTGICIACKPGWYFTIEGRSSLWSRGIVPSRGIIDSTYCGDMVVGLTNWNNTEYIIEAGDRIAQIVLHQQYDMDFEIVDKFGPLYNQRGQAGFGSSGK